VKLHTIDKKKTTKELVGGKRKTTEEESEEHYPITARGLRDPFSTWKSNGILGGDEAIRLGFFHVLLRDGGAHPAGGGRGLGHGVLGGQMFHAHLMRRARGGYARGKEAEEISNGGGRGNELVNSKIPHYAPFISSGRRIVGRDVAQRAETAAHQRSKIEKFMVLPTQRFAMV
jgi:hypothetical protein